LPGLPKTDANIEEMTFKAKMNEKIIEVMSSKNIIALEFFKPKQTSCFRKNDIWFPRFIRVSNMGHVER
jgi:hypothetical protein